MYIKHLSALTHPSHRKPRLVGDLSITHAAVNEHLPQSILREPGCMFALLVIVFAKHISGFLYVIFYFTDAATSRNDMPERYAVTSFMSGSTLASFELRHCFPPGHRL